MATGAGVVREQARLKGLQSFCPVSRKLQQLAASVPEDMGPKGGDGMLGAEPAQPSKAAWKLRPLHPGTLFLASFCPDPGTLPKTTDPCGQEYISAPCLLQPSGKLVSLQCQGMPRPLRALGLECPHYSFAISPHLSSGSLFLLNSLQKVAPGC